MSNQLKSGQPAGLGSLRSGAALALVLAAAAGALPAYAQSGPTPDKVSTSADDNDQPQAGGSNEGERDRVYVLGRRVVSSVATVNAEDAPQVVNIIDEKTLQEQGVTSLEQALRNVPGITTQIGEGGVMSGDQFFIRGISAKNDIFTDGLRDFGVYTRDSFNYGQVEVFKGPSASAFGRGAAGGGINTSSKTPYADTNGSAAIAVGDADYLRVTGDWNQNFGGGMAGRLAAMSHENGNTGRNHIYSERWGVAPSFAFGLDSPTTVTVAYLHQREEKLTDYGIPVINGVPITDYGVNPKNFYGYTSDVDETTVDTITARLRHQANDWLTLTSDLRWGFYQRFARFTPVSCAATCITALTDGNAATIPVTTPGGPGPWDQDTQGVQNITAANITAPLFGLRSEFVGGVDATWQNNDRNQYAYGATRTPLDILNPAFLPGVALAPGKSNIRDTTTRDVSVFASERLWLTDQWSVTGGLRWGSYEVDQNTTTFATTGTTYVGVSSKSDFVTPQIAVIFEPAANQHYYLSYSESAKPQGASANNGDTISNPTTPTGASNKDLDPEENTNIELGGRIGLFEDRVQLQGAVFKTEKGNAKILDVNGDLMVGSGDAQEITGIELGVAGMVTDQWSVNVNATWLDTKITDSSTVANIGKAIQFTPETGASLWTTYNFTGGLAGLEVGGGLTYQGKVWLNAANTAAVPSYTTVDGYVSYGWDRFRVALNGYNLSDELYFAQIHGSRVTPGQGRSFVGTFSVVY
ncbi:MAG TPA: TonB-dependent receptor [Hyphomonadaceae bacterium]|nr:TonB-dependent receptor [Hyphomonadaceae bacterium]HPN04723.1 TonB-dependent receptor [Hyphomonadaceae bacterium]